MRVWEAGVCGSALERWICPPRADETNFQVYSTSIELPMVMNCLGKCCPVMTLLNTLPAAQGSSLALETWNQMSLGFGVNRPGHTSMLSSTPTSTQQQPTPQDICPDDPRILGTSQSLTIRRGSRQQVLGMRGGSCMWAALLSPGPSAVHAAWGVKIPTWSSLQRSTLLGWCFL